MSGLTPPKKIPMKTKLVLLILAIGAVAIGAVVLLVDIFGPPKAKITFIVKDDFGKLRSDVSVGISTFHHWVPGESFGESVHTQYTGTTDKNGRVIFEEKSLTGEFYYGIDATNDKKGFYQIGWKNSSFQFTDRKNGRWKPWNPTIEIIYKPILKPIAMYHGGGRLQLPKRAEEIGFDLSQNDFVAPYGKGEQADLIFKLEEKIPYVSAEKPYDYRLKITFSNKGDGIQPWYGSTGARKMDMPRYAPTANYEDTLELKTGRDAKGSFTQREDEDQNYFFRVRTQLDENGKVTSTLYGKIAGEIGFEGTGFLAFSYDLNPTPLDVNMENDPKKNLIPPKER
jgi:hypothetical protein